MKRKVITSTDYEYMDVTWDGTRYTTRRTLVKTGQIPNYIALTKEESDIFVEFKNEVEGGNYV